MAKYIDYWKLKIPIIEAAFEAGQYLVSMNVNDIIDVGGRANYRGNLTFRFGKVAQMTSGAQQFDDLKEVIINTKHLKPYINNELLIKLDGTFTLTATYKKFSPADLVKVYKDLIANGNIGEVYKWEALSTQHWDLDAPDFTAMYRKIPFHNLLYHNAKSVIQHIAPQYTEEVRDAFQGLFDEATPLDTRIVNFRTEIGAIYRRVEAKYNNHQDERTIATYLTYRYPENYTLYKESFYSTYCKMLGVQSAGVNGKYVHYMRLVDDFKREYIDPDKELLDLIAKFKHEGCFADDNHYLLAQDILYQTLAGSWDDEEPDTISEELIEKLRAFGNPEAVKYFFSLIGKIIADFKWTMDETKLKLTDEPTQQYPMRLTAFIGNNGRALQLYKDSDECYIRWMLSKHLVPDDPDFFNQKPFTNSDIVNVSAPYSVCKQYALQDVWLESCNAYLSSQTLSIL
ncbi:MAG: hypothetical protein EOP48_00840 [Sphingobacteriales bacterium]|nr:MAG: hypothetical protein EOP48_00840 [Sphingobacteriales bacterium]